MVSSFEEEKHFLLLSGIEPRTVHPVTYISYYLQTVNCHLDRLQSSEVFIPAGDIVG
jgi:hypothetical protein